MKRKIIEIDEVACNGCGICAQACHEGAIGMVGGKAKLLRDDYCDGLGDCLPACPTGAISFVEREAAPYNEAADTPEIPSCLSQWPVQIKLAPITAPYFNNAKLLIAADCTAFAYANFHERFIAGRITLVGCPKLDAIDYAEKLAGILAGNTIQDVTLVRMEVPCCGGLENAARRAIEASGKHIPLDVVTISIDGHVL